MLKRILVIDWLEVKFRNPTRIGHSSERTIVLSKDFILKKTIFRKKSVFTPSTYNKHYDLYFRDKKVGCFNCDEKERKDKNIYCRIRIDNWLFYNEIADQLYKELFTIPELPFNNFIRLDIAFDTTQNLVKKMKPFHRGIYAFNDKDNRHNWYRSYKHQQTKEVVYNGTNCYYVNIVGIYCKTLEIPHYGKDYITDFHAANGLSKLVYRAEVRMQAEYIRKLGIDIDGTLLGNAAYLAGIFNINIEKHLIFIPHTQSNVSREDEERLIELIPDDIKPAKRTKSTNTEEATTYDVDRIKLLASLEKYYPDLTVKEALDHLRANCPTRLISTYNKYNTSVLPEDVDIKFSEFLGLK